MLDINVWKFWPFYLIWVLKTVFTTQLTKISRIAWENSTMGTFLDVDEAIYHNLAHAFIPFIFFFVYCETVIFYHANLFLLLFRLWILVIHLYRLSWALMKWHWICYASMKSQTWIFWVILIGFTLL